MKNRILSFLLVLLPFSLTFSSCDKNRNLPYAVDKNGNRMVRSLYHRDVNGKWMDYFYYYYEDGVLRKIEVTEWSLVPSSDTAGFSQDPSHEETSRYDTVIRYREIRIEENRIVEYRDSLPGTVMAQADLENGHIRKSYSREGSAGSYKENDYRYDSEGHLLEIRGNDSRNINWEKGLPVSFVLNGENRAVAYNDQTNGANLNITDTWYALDPNLRFYGWENYCGMKTSRLVGQGSTARESIPYRYAYTFDAYGFPVFAKEYRDTAVTSYFNMNYY